MVKKSKRISIHGGHSGEFCLHAENTLEEVVLAYIDQGFVWAGITEHMPPPADRFRYPDEVAAGIPAEQLQHLFSRYVSTAKMLADQYRDKIDIMVGFETETYAGSEDFIRQLKKTYPVDYIVGSVHHVDDMNFDFSESAYGKAVERIGGADALYCRYFDIQHEMIRALEPEVVGHFDLVRIYDTDYPPRLQKPEIWDRIRRNLSLIRDLNLIMDLNMRSLQKGGTEPYPSANILQEARRLGIRVLPGDDSHGMTSVGKNIDSGIRHLMDYGFDIDPNKPF